MSKITAVVVTFNRLKLLQRVIASLQKQSVHIHDIIIVNNGSTDGTKEWLDKQNKLHIIHQENVGGSGGFYRGIQEASKTECDWIWCMDDDVFHQNIVSKLINIRQQRQQDRHCLSS